MAAEVLSRRMDNNVGAEREGLLQIRRGERVVDREQRAALTSDLRERGDIGDGQQRVGGCLDPDQRRRVRGRGGADCLRVRYRHGMADNSPRRQDLVEQPVRAAVGIVRDQHVITWPADRADQAVLGGHPRRERQRARAALKRGHALLERPSRRIRGARVLVSLDPAPRPCTDPAQPAAAQPSHAVLLVGGHLVDRRDYGARDGIGLLPRVDRQCLESVALLGLRHVTCRLPDHQAGPQPARYMSTSCLVIIPAGFPSTRTTAAPAFSSAAIPALIGSPEPIIGSGGDMWALTGSPGAARPVTSASSRSRSVIDPTTSAAITGGSSFSTGSCETSYSRSVSITACTVSPGCACTNSGNWPRLRSSTSATLGSAVADVRKP